MTLTYFLYQIFHFQSQGFDPRIIPKFPCGAKGRTEQAEDDTSALHGQQLPVGVLQCGHHFLPQGADARLKIICQLTTINFFSLQKKFVEEGQHIFICVNWCS